MNDEELQRSLSELPRERTPYARTPLRRTRSRLLPIAAAIAFAVIGIIGGRLTARSEPTHLLLIRDDASRGDESSRAREYAAWAHDHGIRGERLDDERETFGAGGVTHSSAVHDRAVGGYFLIEARSEGEAEQIARSCPHVGHGGTVELRRIAR